MSRLSNQEVSKMNTNFKRSRSILVLAAVFLAPVLTSTLAAVEPDGESDPCSATQEAVNASKELAGAIEMNLFKGMDTSGSEAAQKALSDIRWLISTYSSSPQCSNL